MRVLVTGADGFVGRHLCALLRDAGDEVVEAHGPRAPEHALDINDALAVQACVEAAKPQGIIHLAGFSSVARSHEQPPQAHQVNGLGAVNLLTAARNKAPTAKLLLIGSGEVYGPIALGARASEEEPLNPTSPYAASKLAAELAALQFHRSYGLHVVLARPFNHLGAGQASHFVVPAFAAQLGRIARGEAEPLLQVGNLEPIRDFSHVKDVVSAYRLLLNEGAVATPYNICSGEGRSIRDLLDEMLRLTGVKAHVEVDPSRLRPAEILSLVGNPLRLERLGWKRRRSASEALKDVLAEQGAKTAL